MGLSNWNVDDTNIPAYIYQGICVFDAVKDLDKISNYRSAEVPFVIRDHPQVIRTAERWNDKTYMKRLLQGRSNNVDFSNNNHFLFYDQSKRRPPGWKEPTERVRMRYDEWLDRAAASDDPSKPHWYFRLNPGK